MKSLTKIFFIAVLLITVSKIEAQTYFSEGFEGGFPTGWNYTFGYSWGGDTVVWKFQNGGYSYFPELYTRHPYPAHTGSKNAMFQREGGYVSTKLITKSINLSYARKPYLKFWHAQDSTYFMGNLINDELKVFYRKTAGSSWVLLAQYTQPQKNWTQRQIELPPSSLTSTYYIAFDGKSNSGFGTCIDDIEIVETDTFPKTVQNISVVHSNNSIVLTSSASNPIIRLNVFVIGNSGTLTLDSLALKSLNTNDNDIYASGVKLFSTVDTLFYNPVLIAQTSFVSSKAILSSINHSLKMGNNYLWVTYDVKDDAEVGDTLDMMLLTHSIKISNKYYPSVNINPAGYRRIVKSALYDDFETNKGWTLAGDFQRTVPLGLGNKYFGNEDPSTAVSGTNIIGTDITTNNGDYPSGAYYSATSPSINCRFFRNTKLSFMRWLNVNGSDNAKIEISNDGGVTWITAEIWKNPSEITDNIWKEQLFDISAYADRMPDVKLRFTLGPTGYWPYSGWNIDNFAVYGNYLAKDVGVTSWLAPLTDCGHGLNDSVKVTVKNYAALPASNIPIVYSFDGSSIIRDTIKTSLPSLATSTFTFKTPKDLSSPVYYNYIYASTQQTGDQDVSNNLFSSEIIAYPTYTAPFLENFDINQSFWVPGGDVVSWQLGSPIANPPASAPNSYESYTFDNEDSYIKSPCIDINDTSKVIIEFKYNSLLQPGAGVAVYSSIDNETTWNLVPKNSYPWKWNWYNNNSIGILGNAGWDTSTNYTWVTAKQVLPADLNNKDKVKFKIVFKSPFFGVEESFAFDDFKIYEAPANIKLISINSHSDTCLKSLPRKISFTINNNGIRTLISTKDTIFAGFRINSETTVYDTLILSSNLPVNQSTILTFKKPAIFSTAGLNSLKVFVIDKNYGFYPVPDKDTLTMNLNLFENPVTLLPTHAASARLDTLVIRAFSDVTNYNYNWADNTHPTLATADTLKNPQSGKVWLSIMKKSDLIHRCTTTDTINITKLIPNIGVDSIVNPVNSCQLKDSLKVKLSFKNTGTDTLAIGDSIVISYKFKNEDTVKLKYFLNKRFYPGDTIMRTFNKKIYMGDEIGYAFTAVAKYKYDSLPNNDTLKRTINVWGLPPVNLGPNRTVAGIETLHAGIGLTSYLWCDNSTNESYDARYIGTHWVEVTDEHSCKNRDSVDLEVVFYDIKPDTVVKPITSCKLGNEKVKVRISNAGTDTIEAGKTIKIKYKVNESPWCSRDTVLTGNFLPASSFIYTFDTIQNFSDTGKYIIKVVTKTTDIYPNNDTLVLTIRNNGNPKINLGSDTTIRALNYVVQLPSDPKLNYLWKNNLTGNSYTINRTDTVHVTATNNVTNCYTKDTIKINILIKDGLLKSNQKYFKACQKALDSLQVTYVNSGNDTIAAGDTVWFWYKVGSYISGKTYLKLASFIAPNDSVHYKYKNIGNNLPIGNSKLIVLSEISKDLRITNNTDTINLQILALPFVDITGAGVDTVYTIPPYTLQAPIGSQYVYNWHDGTHNSSYNVQGSGLFYVQVIDNNNCFNYDSVYVNIYRPDGGITNVEVNKNACFGSVLPLKAWFKNIGTSKMLTGDYIYFDYMLNKSTRSSRYVLTSDLNSGDSISYTFSNILPDLNFGSNKIKVFSVIGEDIEPINDTTTITVNYYNIPLPVIESGADTIIINYNTKIGTGFSSDYSFLWSNGSTLDSITVTSGGKYYVQVTNNTTTCFNTDTVFVKLDLLDGGITSKTANSEYCTGTIDQLTVTFENIGTISFSTGETINISYILNGAAAVTESRILSTDLYSGEKFTYTFTGLGNKFIIGNNTIKVYSKVFGDQIAADDTLTFNVKINSLPDVNLGNVKDTLYAGLPAYLDAGQGPYKYLWQDGNTSRVYSAGSQGTYHVKITDSISGCIGYDTLFVSPLYFDGSITAINANAAACAGTFNSFDATLTNKGDLAFRAGDSIKFGYKVNNGSSIIDGVKLNSNVAIGAKYVHTFNNIANNLIVGNNQFKVFSIIPGDTNAINDTLSFSVKINPLPSVDIGNGKDTLTKDGPVTLIAGPSTGYTYLWQNNSTTNTLLANTTGKYYVRVTNPTTNCSASDTVIVIIDFTDGAITSFTGNSSGCVGNYGALSIEITNQGNRDIPAGETVSIGLNVNNINKLTETLQVTTVLKPTEKITHTFSSVDQYLSLGTNNLKVYITVKDDLYHSNDTATKTVLISDYPNINLAGGNETISFKNSYLLNAGSGFASYLWNTSSTNQSITVTSGGWYKVTVTNTAGCKSKDSVYMKPTVGIDHEFGENALKIYPNPATTSVNIELSYITLSNPVLEIYNVDNKLVFSKQFNGVKNDFRFVLELNAFAKGMYVIKITDDIKAKMYLKRLIIK